MKIGNRKYQVILLSTIVLAVIGYQIYQADVIGAKNKRNLKVVAELSLHGSTPTMSWSPDSSRVVSNSSFEYYGFDELIEKRREDLGIYVLDVATGKSQKIYKEQGYHPFWVSPDRIGWGHSGYEDGTDGLFFSELEKPKVEKIKNKNIKHGVFHTVMGKDGKILFWKNSGWHSFEPKTKKVEWLETKREESKSWGASWDLPEELVQNQCLQKVDDVEVYIKNGYYSLKTSKGEVTVTRDDPFKFFNYGYNTCEVDPSHCGYVKACLSPDKNFLSYFIRAEGRTGYTLKIIDISDYTRPEQE